MCIKKVSCHSLLSAFKSFSDTETHPHIRWWEEPLVPLWGSDVISIIKYCFSCWLRCGNLWRVTSVPKRKRLTCDDNAARTLDTSSGRNSFERRFVRIICKHVFMTVRKFRGKTWQMSLNITLAQKSMQCQTHSLKYKLQVDFTGGYMLEYRLAKYYTQCSITDYWRQCTKP